MIKAEWTNKDSLDLQPTCNQLATTDGNLISRRAAIDALEEQLDYLHKLNKDENPTAESNWYGVNWARNTIADLPSAESETCEGCKHLGKWENEIEYGYPSPCTRCKRRVGDHYER